MGIVKLGFTALAILCIGLSGIIFLGVISPSFADNASIERQNTYIEKKLDDCLAQAESNADRYINQEGYRFESVLDALNRAYDLKNDVGFNSFLPSARKEAALIIDAKISAAFQSILQKCESKLVGEISSVPPPKDIYSGKDKAAFKSALLKAWEEAYPEDVILGVRFPEAKWEREIKKVWEGDAWVKKDMSTLNAKMVVKITSQIAVIYHVLIYKNNISKTWKPAVYTKTDFVSKMMLVSKFK